MKPEDLRPWQIVNNPRVRWVVTAMGMLGWGWLVGSVGSELRQIFQPLGLALPAIVFFGAFSGIGMVIIFMVLSPRQRCPECGELLPKFRKLVSLQQALWGGWECPHCHADLSPDGRRAAQVATGKRR